MIKLLKKHGFILAGVLCALGLVIYFSACNGVMGLGDPVDWEPPVLTLDPKGNPRYVGLNTTLSGTVGDDYRVARVVCQEVGGEGREFGHATLTPIEGKYKVNYKWELHLDFSKENKEDINKSKIACEIVAYDGFGNSGETSIKNVTLIIDLEPPALVDSWIQRTTVRTERFKETYAELMGDSDADTRGWKSSNANFYQNGKFWIAAQMNENETRIDTVELRIYDAERNEDLDEPLIVFDNGAWENDSKTYQSSLYAPVWNVTEDAILQAGVNKFGENYRTEYKAGKRYYYYVYIVAEDRSINRTSFNDSDYFCMGIEGDKPKGIIDPLFGSVIVKGTPIPVEFFDDDSLDWGYAELLRKTQWDALTGDDDHEKLAYLYGELVKNGVPTEQTTIVNWQGAAIDTVTGKPKGLITEALGIHGTTKTVDEFIKPVATGNTDDVYGDYVLFTLVADKKLLPHSGGDIQKNVGKIGEQSGDGTPPNTSIDTNRPQWVGRTFPISIIDDSLAVIVFDTVDTTPTADPPYNSGNHAGYEPDLSPGNPSPAATGNSPEENTFPKLDVDGETFTINGYILRENTGGYNYTVDGTGKVTAATAKSSGGPTPYDHNGVTRFRMAWIPAGMTGGADSYITRVKDILTNVSRDEASLSGTALEGIKLWDFMAQDGPDLPDLTSPATGHAMIEGTWQHIGNSVTGDPLLYRKQVFKKEFNILTDFMYDKGDGPELENDIKLFVFCALDKMPAKDPVFRELRLLGNKKQPEIVVYDLSHRQGLTVAPPILNDFDAPNYVFGGKTYTGGDGNGTISDTERANYEDALREYQEVAFDDVFNAQTPHISTTLVDDEKTDSYTTYPLNTTLKYWVVGESVGDIKVKSITMRDITYSDDTSRLPVGHYDPVSRVLTYTETLPDVTTRSFLFTVTDMLGNTNEIPRTVAISPTAFLESITTTEQSGKYGIDKVILLRANFSRQVKWDSSLGTVPHLSVRYEREGAPFYKLIETSTPANTNVLSMVFPFTVAVGDAGILETADISWESASGPPPAAGWSGGSVNPVVVSFPSIAGNYNIKDAVRGDTAFLPGYNLNNWESGSKNTLQGGGKAIELDGLRPTVASVTVIPGKTAASGQIYYFKAGETIGFQLTTGTGKDILPDGLPRLRFQIQQPASATTWAAMPVNPPTFYADYQRPEDSKTMYFSYTIPETSSVNETTLPNGRIVNITLLNETPSETQGRIIDDANNAILEKAIPSTATPANTLLPANVEMRIDRRAPGIPVPTLKGATLNANSTYESNGTAALNIPAMTTAVADEPWGGTTEYSINNGSTWSTGLTATIAAGTSGTLKARRTDLAGNVAESPGYPFVLNSDFPHLISITAQQPDGWYTSRTQTLRITLGFDGEVRVPTGQNVTITLRDRSTATATATNSMTFTLAGNNTLSSSLVFERTINGDFEMPNGLYLSNAGGFTNMTDKYTNSGVAPNSYGNNGNSYQIGYTNPVYTCDNLAGSGLKIDTMAPAVTAITPFNMATSATQDRTGNVTTSVSTDNRTIYIEFRENIQKGSGTITVKPHGTYAIPAVLENEGYYLGTDGKRYGSAEAALGVTGVTGATWVAGLSDIYNAGLTAAQKNALTESTTQADTATGSLTQDATNPMLSRLRLNAETGQSYGPYMKLTQGLKQGAGFTGIYNNTTPGINAPGATGDDYMIPDTTTKWVLDYQYTTTGTTATQTNIRQALNAAKWRWQEIAVTSSDVKIGTATGVGTAAVAFTENAAGNVVRIVLPEPLLDGLQWELAYGAGTFADIAGTAAPALPNTANTLTAYYWFWSSGAQTPVIRVQRRSYDARTTFPIRTTGSDSGQTYNAAGTYGTVANFNTINYRIETETPGARIYAGQRLGTSFTSGGVPIGSITGNFTGAIANAGAGGTTSSANFTWNSSKTGTNNAGLTRGTWVLPNLVYRSATDGQNYQVPENGANNTYIFSGNFKGIRSWNKDAQIGELNSIDLAALGTTTSQTGNFTYDAYQASKNYVIAEARVIHNGTTNYATPTYTSVKGYEGVFRTVVMLNQADTGGTTPILLMGSNVKNGLPNVAGFPVRDAVEERDTRYLKLFNRVTNTTYYWVTTEIVTSWYSLNYGRGNGGRHQSQGDANNYLYSGYGDLSYGFNVGAY